MALKLNVLKTIFFLSSIFLTLTACEKDSTSKENNGNEKAMKFMSYNIHIGNPPSQPSSVVDMDAIAKVINNVSPDFVALQEVDKFTDRSGKTLDQAAKLAELTKMHYQFFKAINRSNGEYGVAILSKYPIIEYKQVSLPVNAGTNAELRTAGWILVKLEDGTDFVFASVHLDHIADSNRELQTREMLKALKSYQKYPIVIGGDFNMNQSNSLWDLIKVIFHVPCTNCPSTHSATKPTTAIDYLLLNNTANDMFKLKSYTTFPETYASDHLPVVMELKYQTK